MTFTKVGCEIRDPTSKLVACEYREGSLYYLDQGDPTHQVCLASSFKENIWHRRFGHLGISGMKALSKNRMVTGFDFDWKQKPEFSEPCAKRKDYRLSFQKSSKEGHKSSMSTCTQ